jgi:hypothetical protein
VLPTDELFVYVYVLIHDLMPGGGHLFPRPPDPLAVGGVRVTPA